MSNPFRPPAAILAAISVSQDDLDFLRHTDPAAASPYLSVYPSRRGWQARAFKKRIGRVVTTPRDAALVVARWWKHHYADRWREYFALRQTPGWLLLPAPDGGWHPVVHLAERDGDVVRERVRVLPVVYGSKQEAVASVKAWAGKRYGGRATLVVRRWWTPTHRAERRTPVPQVGLRLA